MPVLIPKAGRTDEFFPMERFEEQQIYNTLISYYPNYLYVCHHIYHFHPERWATIAPTWWQWHSWWSLPWHNQWGLWWWYTHSGYPIPAGLTQDIAERIRSANPRLLQLVSDEQPPFVITSKGAVSPDAILTTLYKGKPPSKQVPILPSNPKILEKLQEEAEKEIKRPERIQETLNEVEPSKRGKLYGIREAAVRQSDYDATLKPDVPRVKLPRKPILTPGEPQKATVNHDEVEPEKQRTKAKAPNPEVELVPVKDLKEAKGKVEAEKTARPKHIPPPDATIIQQVLPGPRVGPPIEFDENKNVVPPPHKTDLQPTPEEKSTVPNLRA